MPNTTPKLPGYRKKNNSTSTRKCREKMINKNKIELSKTTTRNAQRKLIEDFLQQSEQAAQVNYIKKVI